MRSILLFYWAHISEVYFASNRYDAENAGFDDSHIYDELTLPLSERKIKMAKLEEDTAVTLFEKWNQKLDKEKY